MSNEREKINTDLGEDLDLGAAIKMTEEKPNFSQEERNLVAETSEKAGFPSRQAKKVRRKRIKSPYTEQLGFKARPIVKEVFQEFSDSINIYDYTTFEQALIALLEKEGRKDLLLKLEKEGT